MKEFIKKDKVFIKSNNETSKIYNRYLYCLISFVIFIVIYNLIWGSVIDIINLLKSIFVSLFTLTIIQYVFNLGYRKKGIMKILFENQILSIAIILGLFSMGCPIWVSIVSSILTIVMKNILKKMTISSSLYGILVIILAKYYLFDLDTPLINLTKFSYVGTYDNIINSYGGLLNYILGIKIGYLSPILSILCFIYLFHKKSIKYNIVFSYVLTISFIMLITGLVNDMNIWYLFFQLTTGNILFLTVFTLGDYPITPTTQEGQLIYGILLGIITGILRFIIPELSVVITLILGPILFTKLINNISFKLKYNYKYYYSYIVGCLILVIITTTIINVLI